MNPEERGRDAAQRVLLNTPHPLTVLSDPKAYGSKGSISRHHNPFNYLRALGKTRRTWEGERWEVVVEGAPGATKAGARAGAEAEAILEDEEELHI